MKSKNEAEEASKGKGALASDATWLSRPHTVDCKEALVPEMTVEE